MSAAARPPEGGGCSPCGVVAQRPENSSVTEPLLALQGISKTFSRGRHQVTHALKNVSLDVHPGEIVALGCRPK